MMEDYMDYMDRQEYRELIDDTEFYEKQIEELQEENKHLDAVNCKLRKGGEALKDTNKLLLKQKGQLQKDLDMLSNRIDKAIEKIEKDAKLMDLEDGYTTCMEVIEILRGEDNE